MQQHREYWEKMTAYLLNTVFNGDRAKYEEYLNASFNKVEPILEGYSRCGNEFWLKEGDERAFYQAIEPTLLMPVEKFEEETSELLGRDFKYSELLSDDDAERERLLKEFRKEVQNAFRVKHPDLYQQYIERQHQAKQDLKKERYAEFEGADLEMVLTPQN